jgi:hypothetical protein
MRVHLDRLHGRARHRGLRCINPTQTLSATTAESGFQGLNHFDQRTADGGNQYSLTPPDQGRCVGNGQVVEAINNAIRVYDTSGLPLDATASVNQFFWGDHFIDRSTGITIPHNMGDLSCLYDAGSNRFHIAAFDLVVDAAGSILGPSFVDFAVSDPGTALGGWTIYQVDTTDDGTDGTPSHPVRDDLAEVFGDIERRPVVDNSTTANGHAMARRNRRSRRSL